MAARDVEFVIDKVKLHLEEDLAVRHRGRGETTSGDVKRDVPPVVYERRLSKTNLADDLRPHVQRGTRVLPFFQW